MNEANEVVKDATVMLGRMTVEVKLLRADLERVTRELAEAKKIGPSEAFMAGQRKNMDDMMAEHQKLFHANSSMSARLEQAEKDRDSFKAELVKEAGDSIKEYSRLQERVNDLESSLAQARAAAFREAAEIVNELESNLDIITELNARAAGEKA